MGKKRTIRIRKRSNADSETFKMIYGKSRPNKMGKAHMGKQGNMSQIMGKKNKAIERLMG